MTEQETHIHPVDLAVALSAAVLGAAGGAARRAGSALDPLAGMVLQPRWLPRQLRPGRWIETMSQEGEALRRALLAEISRRLDVLVPLVVDPIVNRVDLDAAAKRLDIDAVLDRVDLVRLAAEVIEGVDLPEIIRESTGSMASDSVQGLRMQGIVADEAVGRAVDRLLLRRRSRSTQAPTAPGALSSDQSTLPAQSDPTP